MMLKLILLFAAVLILGFISLDLYLYNRELAARLGHTEAALVELQTRMNSLYNTVHAHGRFHGNANMDLPDTDEVVSFKQLRPSDPAQELSKILHRRRRETRTRRKAKPKRCKNCLPSVEFEGSGVGYQMKKDKNDVSGLWKPALWLQGATTSGPYKFSKIDQNGAVEIKKSGLYIVYAQMSLIGTPGGFKIEKIAPSETVNTGTTVASCKDFTQAESGFDNYSCFTMRVITLNKEEKGGFYIKKIFGKGKEKQILASCTCRPADDDSFHTCFTMKLVQLAKKESVYVEELNAETRGLYSPSTAYFGLIRVGNSNT